MLPSITVELMDC